MTYNYLTGAHDAHRSGREVATETEMDRTYTTINDLHAGYSDLCGSNEPELSRDELRADYQAWCAAHGVDARYEVTGAAYLAADDGPWAE